MCVHRHIWNSSNSFPANFRCTLPQELSRPSVATQYMQVCTVHTRLSVKVLDIGYLCIQPRAWIRVPRTTTVPICGPPVGMRASRTLREAHRQAGVPGWRRVSDRSTPWAGQSSRQHIARTHLGYRRPWVAVSLYTNTLT